MAFAQSKYNELQGVNGRYRINQIGCFLVSFCNLLERFGKPIDPLGLNREFIKHGIYIDIDDGVRDDLGWTSITRLNPNIVVTRTGGNVPPSNNCIVKFTGLRGFGTHFSLVADAAKGLIIDSFDGNVKSWNVYGGPKAWAEYKDNTVVATPQHVTPVPTSPAYNGAEITILMGWGLANAARAAGYQDWDSQARWSAIAALNGSSDWKAYNAKLYPGQRIRVGSPQAIKPTAIAEFVTVQRGWGLSNVAQAAGYADFDTQARWSHIAKLNGSSNWSDFNARLITGQSIRTKEAAATPAVSAAPPPQPTPAPKPAPSSEPDNRVTVKVNKSYKDTFQANPKTYIAATSMEVYDLDGLLPVMQLTKNQKVNAAGTFVKKSSDGKLIAYAITVNHKQKNMWYGIPTDALVSEDNQKYIGKLLTDDDDDDDIFNIDMSLEVKEMMNNLTGHEKIVAIVGKIQSVFIGIANKFKMKGNK